MAERKNQTIEDAARAMVDEDSMPKFYWAELVKTAVYFQNWTFATGGKVSPHELYFEHMLNLGHLRVFSSITYVHVSNQKWRKFNVKAKKVSWMSKRVISVINIYKSPLMRLTTHSIIAS